MKKKALMYANEFKDFKLTLLMAFFVVIVFLVVGLGERAEVPFYYYLIMFVLFVGPFFLINLKYVLNYNHNLKIMRYGQRLDGYIVDLDYKISYGKHVRVYYYLIVKYFNPYTNQEMLYMTPKVNFDPIEDLGERRCSVYITNNEIYVSDFVARLENQDRLWSEEVIKNKNSKDLLKKGNINVLKYIGTIFLILILIAILSTILR